jgi:Putative beta barrel porin-7 (BBP7)
MCKRWIVSLTSVLITASFALGQGSEPQPPKAQPPETLPAPAAPAAKTPDAPAAKTLEMPAGEKPGASSASWLDLPLSLKIGDGTHRAVIAEADYMMWFQRSSLGSFPVSTSNPATGSIVGDLDNGPRSIDSGGRFTLGYWMIEDNAWVRQGIPISGVEARFFFVGSRSGEIDIDAPATLFRPFFDLNNRAYSGFLIAAPGVATGSVSGHAQGDIWGAEANFWKNVYFDGPGTSFAVNVMAGFRYLNANTELGINSTSVFNPIQTADPTFAAFAGNRLQVSDSFATRNNFYGGQVGIGFTSWFESFANLETSLRVALGTTSQDLSIAGGQLRTFANGTTAAFTGGLLALPSNIGTWHVSKFTQVPEVDFKLNFPICSYLTLSTGFSALYWNRVLRASEQLDHSIDITQIPNYPQGAGATPTGLGRPGISFQQSDLWLLGINIGAEFRW